MYIRNKKAVVKVTRPILTEEEKKRRLNELYKAAEKLLKNKLKKSC